MKSIRAMAAAFALLSLAFLAGCQPATGKDAAISYDFRPLVAAEIGTATSTAGDADAPILVDPSLGGTPNPAPSPAPVNTDAAEELAEAKRIAMEARQEVEKLKAEMAAAKAQAEPAAEPEPVQVYESRPRRLFRWRR